MTAAEREGRYIIALLRSFLTDADLTDEGEHDWKELYRQTCRHQMVALVYDALPVSYTHLTLPTTSRV